jgi:hypothetical protein
MKQSFSRITILAFSAAVLSLSSACGSKEEAPPPVAIEEVPETIAAAFQSAEAEVRQVVNETVAAIQGQDDSRAFLQLQMLCDRPDLTPEQRAVASAGMVAVNLRLQEAAAAGNKEAAQVLELHRSRK